MNLLKAGKWALLNFGTAALFWVGITHNENLTYLAVTILWVSLVMTILALIAAHAGVAEEELKKAKRSVPAWVAHLFDVAFCIYVCWNGWIITAVFMLVQNRLETFFFNKAKEVQDA